MCKNKSLSNIVNLSKMNKNTLFLAIAIGGIPFVSASERKPFNIVHIMSDDHSFQAISAYGHPLSKLAPTPNMDRLAAEGVLFRRAFVENSLSTPSRACLITGLYSHQNGQRQLGKGIDTTKTFISELLQAQGYQTAVVGKWHMQCEPKGFDYYRIVNGQGDYYNPAFKSKMSNGKYVSEEGYATKLITDHAIEFLDNRDKNKPFTLFVHHKAPHRNWMPEGKYLNLYEDVEFPYPETFYDDYSTRCDAARSQEMTIAKNLTLITDLKVAEWETGISKINWDDSVAVWTESGLKDEQIRQRIMGQLTPAQRESWNWRQEIGRWTPEQRKAWDDGYSEKNKTFLSQNLKDEELVKWKYQRYIKDYLRCIKTIDDEVGRLVKYLEEQDLLENTILVYTSDQGFYMGEHGWFDKRFMYEESLRTPLIIRYPGENVPRGITCDALVQNIDYAATYLDVAGIGKTAEMSGLSLLPLLADGQTPDDWRKDLYYHYYDYPAVHQVRRHDGVRSERYKLIHFYGEGEGKDEGNDIDCHELYDLQNDPNELNNVYGHADYKDVREHLQKRLDKYRADLNVDEY
jgi:arylsulfatase A-like enzyme